MAEHSWSVGVDPNNVAAFIDYMERLNTEAFPEWMKEYQSTPSAFADIKIKPTARVFGWYRMLEQTFLILPFGPAGCRVYSYSIGNAQDRLKGLIDLPCQNVHVDGTCSPGEKRKQDNVQPV